MKLSLCILPVIVMLSACSAGNVEKDFLCGAQTGTPCTSLSDIDGGLSGSTATPVAEDGVDTQNKSLSRDPLSFGKGGQVVSSLSGGGPAYQSARYRIPEKTGRLWLAPRLDDAEVLHEATFVHFVLREAQWGTRK